MKNTDVSYTKRQNLFASESLVNLAIQQKKSMKKYTIILMCLFGIFQSQFIHAQAVVDESAAISTTPFYQKISENKNRMFFSVNMNELRENQRAAFVNQLYASKILVVNSRINEQGVLQISCSITTSLAEVDKEINRIKEEVTKVSVDAIIEKY